MRSPPTSSPLAPVDPAIYRALHPLEHRLVRIEASTVRRLHDRRKSQRSTRPEIWGEREKTPRPLRGTGQVRYTGALSVRLDDAEWSEEQGPETHRDSRRVGKTAPVYPPRSEAASSQGATCVYRRIRGGREVVTSFAGIRQAGRRGPPIVKDLLHSCTG